MWGRIGTLAGILIVLLSIVISASHPPAAAQANDAPCGYIDGFEYPVPGIDVNRTDFGIYRSRFGGLHTGIDVAFGDLGEPVRAGARGLVTYSDIEGWDTEKGVVVIQHTLPDGTLVNTLYGHMEELNGHTFPPVDTCVEQGQIIGAIGDPSLSRPHLHFEVRTRYRYEGGPGYTQTNPLELGWLHPIDFAYLARLMAGPAYRGHFTLTERPSLPPLLLADGTYVVAHGTTLRGITAAGHALWQFDLIDTVNGLLALPDGRVLATTTTNQVLVLKGGSYSALWTAPHALQAPPLLIGGTVVLIGEDATLWGATPEGGVLWETPLPTAAVRWAVAGNYLAVSTTSSDLVIVDQSGQILHNNAYPDAPVPVATPENEFLVLSGSRIERLDGAFQAVPLIDTVNGLLALPDGRVLATTTTNQVLVLNGGSYSALWTVPHALQAPPLLVGGTVVFIGEDATLRGATPEGSVLWETPLPEAAVRWAVAGNYLAVSTTSSDLVIVDQSGQILHNNAYPDAPVPVATPENEFLVLSGSRIERLDGAFQAVPLIDTGRAVSPAADVVRGPAGEFYVYTGEGRALYAYDSGGNVLWNAYMPGSHRRAPLLGLGGGQLLYALNADGQLLAYRTADGRLAAQLALYNGGTSGVPNARWMHVAPDDTVTFGSGFLSAITLNGLDLLEETPLS